MTPFAVKYIVQSTVRSVKLCRRAYGVEGEDGWGVFVRRCGGNVFSVAHRFPWPSNVRLKNTFS
jgi:hypothetical protein